MCATATGSFVLVLRVIIADDEAGQLWPVCGRAGGYRTGVDGVKMAKLFVPLPEGETPESSFSK